MELDETKTSEGTQCTAAPENIDNAVSKAQADKPPAVTAPVSTEPTTSILTRTSTGAIKKLKKDWQPVVETPTSRSPVQAKKGSRGGRSMRTPEVERHSGLLWSSLEKELFFAGVCQFWKKFDSITQFMNVQLKKRGLPAMRRDQIRYFYYRTLAKLQKYITFDGQVSRPVQELYALINYSVFRKHLKLPGRDGGTLLNELVHRGEITIRVRRKMLKLRTPACPALKLLISNYFTELGSLQDPGIPDTLRVELRPANMRAWGEVQRISHNPRVMMTVKATHKLRDVVEHLQKKWSHVGKLYENSDQLCFSPAQRGVLTLRPPTGTKISPIEVVQQHRRIESRPVFCLDSFVDALQRSQLESAREAKPSRHEKGSSSAKGKSSEAHGNEKRSEPKANGEEFAAKWTEKARLLDENAQSSSADYSGETGSDAQTSDVRMSDSNALPGEGVANASAVAVSGSPENSADIAGAATLNGEKETQNSNEDVDQQEKEEDPENSWCFETAVDFSMAEVYLLIGNRECVPLVYDWLPSKADKSRDGKVKSTVSHNDPNTAGNLLRCLAKIASLESAQSAGTGKDGADNRSAKEQEKAANAQNAASATPAVPDVPRPAVLQKQVESVNGSAQNRQTARVVRPTLEDKVRHLSSTELSMIRQVLENKKMQQFFRSQLNSRRKFQRLGVANSAERKILPKAQCVRLVGINNGTLLPADGSPTFALVPDGAPGNVLPANPLQPLTMPIATTEYGAMNDGVTHGVPTGPPTTQSMTALLNDVTPGQAPAGSISGVDVMKMALKHLEEGGSSNIGLPATPAVHTVREQTNTLTGSITSQCVTTVDTSDILGQMKSPQPVLPESRDHVVNAENNNVTYADPAEQTFTEGNGSVLAKNPMLSDTDAFMKDASTSSGFLSGALLAQASTSQNDTSARGILQSGGVQQQSAFGAKTVINSVGESSLGGLFDVQSSVLGPSAASTSGLPPASASALPPAESLSLFSPSSRDALRDSSSRDGFSSCMNLVLQDMVNESSVDFMANFAELVKELNSEDTNK